VLVFVSDFPDTVYIETNHKQYVTEPR